MKKQIVGGVLSLLIVILVLALTPLAQWTQARAAALAEQATVQMTALRSAKPQAAEPISTDPAQAEERLLLHTLETDVPLDPEGCLPDGPLQLQNGSLCLIMNGLPAAVGLNSFSGGLYYTQADGTLLTDLSWENLTFGTDGRYTSGNPEIDAFVDALILQAAGNRTGREALEACYRHIVQGADYQAGPHYPHGAPEEDWLEESMLRLMERGQGNCYSYAAEIVYVARRLGFPARGVSGAVDWPGYDHGWAELELDGNLLILDPELNHTRLSRDPGALFLTSYEDAPYTYYPPEIG